MAASNASSVKDLAPIFRLAPSTPPVIVIVVHMPTVRGLSVGLPRVP